MSAQAVAAPQNSAVSATDGAATMSSTLGSTLSDATNGGYFMPQQQLPAQQLLPQNAEFASQPVPAFPVSQCGNFINLDVGAIGSQEMNMMIEEHNRTNAGVGVLQERRHDQPLMHQIMRNQADVAADLRCVGELLPDWFKYFAAEDALAQDQMGDPLVYASNPSLGVVPPIAMQKHVFDMRMQLHPYVDTQFLAKLALGLYAVDPTFRAHLNSAGVIPPQFIGATMNDQGILTSPSYQPMDPTLSAEHRQRSIADQLDGYALGTEAGGMNNLMNSLLATNMLDGASLDIN